MVHFRWAGPLSAGRTRSKAAPGRTRAAILQGRTPGAPGRPGRGAGADPRRSPSAVCTHVRE
eukprot:9023364-Alexandrium_andersonii.AAC.1